MKNKAIAVFFSVVCAFLINACYHSYADYVEDIEVSYSKGYYYLTWTPLADADSYIVYAQYSYGEKTYLKELLETTEPGCTISSSSIPYSCNCLRVAAVKDGHKSYLSKKISIK